MTSICPFLWFDANLEEAADFYTGLFPDAKVHSLHHGPDGKVMTGEFELMGQQFKGINGGPHFQFNEAISIFVTVDGGQAEVDRLWNALTADGGEESQCGWLKDKFGLSWQIVPQEFFDLVSSGTPEQSGATFGAMMQMQKFDIAALQAAYDGAS